MRFLTLTQAPKLTFARTNRKCVIDEAKDLIMLYETTVKIEITIPSIWQGIKDKVEKLATQYLVNGFSSSLQGASI